MSRYVIQIACLTFFGVTYDTLRLKIEIKVKNVKNDGIVRIKRSNGNTLLTGYVASSVKSFS